MKEGNKSLLCNEQHLLDSVLLLTSPDMKVDYRLEYSPRYMNKPSNLCSDGGHLYLRSGQLFILRGSKYLLYKDCNMHLKLDTPVI